MGGVAADMIETSLTPLRLCPAFLAREDFEINATLVAVRGALGGDSAATKSIFSDVPFTAKEMLQMATELLREKIGQLEGQVNAMKIEKYLHEIRIEDMEKGALLAETDYNKAANVWLKQEGEQSLARLAYLNIQLGNREGKLIAMKKELAEAEAAAKTAQAS